MRGLFCFGMGYCARRLAAALPPAWEVTGTARAPAAESGLVAFDGTAPLADPAPLRRATHILISIPPAGEGDPAARLHAADITAARNLEWLGYLSTTGVYGTRDGGWVDEESALTPSGTRGARRVAAEEAWLDLWRREGVPVQIFRLAGIYGPGRNQLETVRAGTAKRIDKPDQVFSRIHVDDIVQVLLASMARPDPGRIYNVCDDEPANPAEVVAYAAELLGVEPPPLVPFDRADLSPMARSFYADNKRVRNRRIKDELGIELRYPSYREGLRALLETLG